MEKVQSADGTAIAFDRSGGGAALILVAGAFSDPSSTKTLALKLGARFTVYEYDRRGRGDSGDAPAYSTELEVDDLPRRCTRLALRLSCSVMASPTT